MKILIIAERYNDILSLRPLRPPWGHLGSPCLPDASQMPPRCLPDASQMPPRCLPDASQFPPSPGAQEHTPKKRVDFFVTRKSDPPKWSQRSPNGVPKWLKIDQKLIKCRFWNLSWKMRGKITKIRASGYSKTVVSHGRGCIFQGFQCLQKVGKTTPEIVSKCP